jgi:hypothetical protein
MAFVKVVGGSEIYNFPIHHLLHFSTNFWRKSYSNRGSATRFQASWRSAPRRRATPARRSSPRSFPRPTRAPRRIESRAPRASPLLRRTCAVRAADRRSVRGPGRTRAGRGASWYGDIFAVTTTSSLSRPYLRSAAFPPRARHRRSRSPPHPPWTVAGEIAPPSFPSAFQPPEPPLYNM